MTTAPADVETRDAPPARIVVWGAVLMVTLAIFAGGVWLTVDFSHSAVDPTPAEVGARRPSTPHLQASPATDAAAYHAAMDAKLRGYGWADRARDIARIPVNTAMDILADQGWPMEASP